MIIKIGDKDISGLTPDNLIEIAKLEGVHCSFEYFSDLTYENFSNSLFSDTLVIDLKQYKISDPDIERVIVFFFNFKEFSFHWYFINDIDNMRHGRQIKMTTIKYLLEEGFNLPIY